MPQMDIAIVDPTLIPLFKVNRVANALDILGEFNFLIFFLAKAIQENISEGGKMAMINTMALLDRESDGRRFIDFNDNNI